MNKRPGHVEVTTEVAYCSFCDRVRNLRREEHHLGTLVRTIVTCESCHRTLSSTMGVVAADAAEVEAPAAEAATPSTPATTDEAPAPKPPVKRATVAKPRPAAAKSKQAKPKPTRK